MKVDKLHKELTDSGYLCTRQFAAQVSASINNQPVAGAFLYGPAGTGKSYLPIIISQITGHKMFFFQCAPGTKEDDLLMKLWPDEDTASGVKVSPGAVYEAAEASHKKKVILVLDEWDKTRPTADAFLLDFFQYGRISIPGKQTTAKFENMMVFFTANDERQFHEAFYRRFPKIDMAPLAPKLVHQALELTHKDNPHINTMVMLYKRTLAARLPKAATIQELRQLMDAIDHLGVDADWNTLVYQFVTKTEENHQLLATGEENSDEVIQREMVALDPDVYSGVVSDDGENDTKKVMMPEPVITQFEDIDMTPDDSGEAISASNSTLLMENTNSAYTFLYRMAEGPSEHSGRMEWAKLCGSHLINDKIIYLEEIYRIMNELDATYQTRGKAIRGEVMLSEPLATLDDINWIINFGSSLHVHKATEDEVIFRGHVSPDIPNSEIDFRWSKDNGLDIICPLKYLELLVDRYLGHRDSTGRPSNALLAYTGTVGYNEYYNACNVTLGITGDFHLKALARKDTYMDCTFDNGWGMEKFTSPMPDKDIPHHDEFTRLDKMVIVPSKMHKTYTYGNVEWKFYHHHHKRNIKLRIRINGHIEPAVEPFLMEYAYSGNLPLTRACVHSMEYEDIKAKLTEDGWFIEPDARTFIKDMLKAKLLGNVIVFTTKILRVDWPDDFVGHVNTCIDILDILCEDYGD